jgi:hypothetical protein
MRLFLNFVLLLALSGCSLGQHNDPPLIELDIPQDPANDFRQLQEFFRTYLGSLSSSQGECDYVYDHLARVYDLGDVFVKVFPHNYSENAVVIQIVAGRMKSDTPFSELLYVSPAMAREPSNIVTEMIEIRPAQSKVGIGGIYLGQHIEDCIKDYEKMLREFGVSNDMMNNCMLIARGGLQGTRHCFNYGKAQVVVGTKNGHVVAITWMSKRAPGELIHRVREEKRILLAGRMAVAPSPESGLRSDRFRSLFRPLVFGE